VKHKWLFHALVSCLCFLSVSAFAMERQEAREWGLPNFQERELERDLPVRDLMTGPDGTVWLLGRSALWNWDLNKNTLRRILLVWEERVLEPAGVKKAEKLVSLGSDGSSVFVGSTRYVYQIASQDTDATPKVMRYKIPGSSKVIPVGFAGVGERFMWVTSTHAFLFDRYGKKLRSVPFASPLRATDNLLALDSSEELLVSRDKQIWKIKLTKSPAGVFGFEKPVTVQKLSNPVVGLLPLPGGYLAHTAFTVMHQSWTGKRLQTIPVENDRKIARAYADDKRHAYIFSDGLCEVYDLKPESVRRYQLSPDLIRDVQAMLLPNESNLLLLAGGKVTAFSLSQGVAATRVSRK